MHNLAEKKVALARAWEKIELKTRLPADMSDFFERTGMMPRRRFCRRTHQRFFLGRRAIVRCQDKLLAVYSVDASRRGIRFLSPVELTPKERARIQLPSTKEFHIEITRCQQIAEHCYDCGAIFVLTIRTEGSGENR